jgi:magnesium-transporting ATPase (P-type)
MQVVIPSNNPSPVAPKHTGMGVVSFIISLLGFFIFVCTIIAGGVIAMKNPDALSQPGGAAVVIGMLILIGFFLCFVGIGLGIAGLVQKDRKKIFALLGLIFNSAIFIGVAILMIVGLMTNRQPPVM